MWFKMVETRGIRQVVDVGQALLEDHSCENTSGSESVVSQRDEEPLGDSTTVRQHLEVNLSADVTPALSSLLETALIQK